MKINSLPRPLVVAAILVAGLSFRADAATNIFSTQFEIGEGYTTTADLIGQNGWTGEGSGGNVLTNNGFPGQGQQAYIGKLPPVNIGDDLYVWRPLDYFPIADQHPAVKFSVSMSIEDSVNGNYDNFRWIVYNSQVDRLILIDFDNYTFDVSYALEDSTSLLPTGLTFANSVIYTLTVTMNFEANLWSATLNNNLIATNQPLTTAASPLDLGDIDGVWSVYDPNNPGDNFMMFDNYAVTATRVRPAVEFLGRAINGNTSVRLHGENAWKIAVDASTNLTQWTPLKTNTLSGNFSDYTDTGAVNLPRRFYRARLVP